MSGYVPTTEHVRGALRPYRVHPREFDAWLSAHEEQVRAEERAATDEVNRERPAPQPTHLLRAYPRRGNHGLPWVLNSCGGE